MAGTWQPILQADAKVKTLARSVVAIVDIYNWEKLSKESFRVKKAFATGFLHPGGKVITASHVIGSPKIDGARVVFDYLTDEDGGVIISATKVYEIKNSEGNDEFDWGWIKLNKKVNRKGLFLREFQSKKAAPNNDDYDQKVFAIGHPDGQSGKYSGLGTVETIDDDQPIFIVGFSVTEGASGSPIFSINDQAVIGIAIEQYQDRTKCLKADVFIDKISGA